MEKGLVSVIIPVYNVEKYVDKCIESVVKQTYKNLEIVLIDDGSTDSSDTICDEWGGKDNRIIVIHKENGGLSDARNVGLNNARGEYYTFIDSDDYISLDMIETLMNCAVKYSSEIAVCNMIRVSEKGDFVSFYRPEDREKVLNGEERFQTLIQPSVCNKLFKAKLFDRISFPKGKYYEDTFIYHYLVYRANKICFTGKDSYFYLARGDSIVGQPQYTIRYFDFIEAIWCRANFLLRKEIQPYGDEACLSFYAAFANAEKNISYTEETEKKFKEYRKKYKWIYKKLMKHDRELNGKQKLRLILLRYFPRIYCKIY